MDATPKQSNATQLPAGSFHKPKLNQRYEIREIDNGYIVTGWIQGEYFEVYREDLKTVEFFISTKLK